MNRIMADGLLNEARDGALVAVLSKNRTELRAAFDAMATRVDGAQVFRANGRERINFNGARGSVRFVTPDGARGLSANLVYIPRHPDYETMRQLVRTAAIITATGGEVLTD